MSLIMIGAMTAAVATMANNQEESPLLWGILTFVLCFIGTMVMGILGSVITGVVAIGLLQLKIARFG